MSSERVAYLEHQLTELLRETLDESDIDEMLARTAAIQRRQPAQRL